MKNCDGCRYYQWYYDKCKLWNCYTDPRSVCNHFEEIPTIIRNIMVGNSDNKERL